MTAYTCARSEPVSKSGPWSASAPEKQCENAQPHPDHYWSTKGHPHQAHEFVCIRYCVGRAL